LAAGLLSSSFALAQNQQAASLDQLLDLVKRSQVNETAEHRQREAEFARDTANQANLRAQAKATRQAEEARPDRPETTFAEQEITKLPVSISCLIWLSVGWSMRPLSSGCA